jgi:prefoldin subunit 5
MAQSRHRDIETIRKLQTEVRSLLQNIKKMQQNRLALSKLNNVTRDLFAQAKER